MARIVSYKYERTIGDGDAWVGTDASSLATRQFTAADLADYLNIQGKISISGQMLFKYTINAEGSLGTFSLTGGGINFKSFSGITNLVVATQDRTPQNVVKFLEYMVDAEIYVGKQGEISTFGHYRVTRYSVSPSNPNFYNLELQFLGGNGNMVLDELYNIVNFVKSGGGDKHFTFAQEVLSATWNITHNLDKYPSVSITNLFGQEVFAEVDYINKNELVIKFADALVGAAYMN
jgi:hypothetical protein